MNVSFSVFNNDGVIKKLHQCCIEISKLQQFFSPLIIKRSQYKRIIDLELRKLELKTQF